MLKLMDQPGSYYNKPDQGHRVGWPRVGHGEVLSTRDLETFKLSQSKVLRLEIQGKHFQNKNTLVERYLGGGETKMAA